MFLYLLLTSGCEEYMGTQNAQILRQAVVIPLCGAQPHFDLIEHASTEVN